MPASARSIGGAKAAAFPEQIGKYRLLLPIGFGGMSTVYLALHEGPAGFRREVALKWVHANVPGFSDLALHLLREARIVGQIRHPHVVQMVDAGEAAEGIYLVMEYVEGGTLAGLASLASAEGAALPLPIALRILSDALTGLHAAHELRDEHGRLLELVHRDFSPQNILVGVAGDVKLGDFGIAKVEHTSHRTRTGLVKGTVTYMSPEQVRGQPLDRRSDLWSAGIVAWELFTGAPFHGKREAIAAAMSTLTGRIPRLRSVRPELPEALDEAVAAALTRTPRRRCQTALELRDSVLAAAGVPPASTEEVAAYALRAFAPELDARRAQVEQRLNQPRAELARVQDDANPALAAVGEVEPPTRRGSRLPAGLALAALLGLGGFLWLQRAPLVAPAATAPTVAGSGAAVRAPSVVEAPPQPTALVVPRSTTPAASSENGNGAPHLASTPLPGAHHSRLTSGAAAPLRPEPISTPNPTTPAAPPLADNPYARSRSDPR